MNLAMTVDMHESQIIEVFRSPELLGNDMMDMEFLAIFERLVADRAGTLLPRKQRAVSVTLSRHCFCASLPPVVLQGGVVGRIILWD